MERDFPVKRFETAKFLQPILMLAAAAIPQILLLFVNLYYYSIVSGEMKEFSRVMQYFFAAEILLAIIPVVFSVSLFIRKKSIGIIIPILTIILSSTYLWIFSMKFSDLLPRVPSWIISQEHILFYQFAFMMPSIIFSIVCISLFRLRAPRMKRALLLFTGTIAIPAFWFLAMFEISRFVSYSVVSSIIYPSIALILVSTIALYVLLFRLVLSVWLMTRRRWNKTVQMVFCILFGLMAPLGGLILNRHIPFPADFQYWQVYALAIANGIFLVIPVTGRVVVNRALFVFRAMFFPFTFYFFMVFIPFTPLSIPAIIAAGAGFLVLTPSIIFVLHLRVMIEDFRRIFINGNFRRGIIITACLLLILPAFIAVRAAVDRYTIHSAIEYVYQGDYVKDVSFHGSTGVLRNTLENLVRSKEGNSLPFISPLYDYIVFGNLTLPDSKIGQISHAFFGDMPETERSHNHFYSIFSGSDRWQPHTSGTASAADVTDSNDVLLQAVHVEKEPADKDFLRAKVTLDMKNTNDRLNLDEFRARITTSDGVFVSGYWLYVGSNRVPGRIFEKKTATWVYEMIRETRRDPGLLLYTGDNNLLLRVFPFSRKEVRRCEIEFMYPKNASPELVIAGRHIDLPHGEKSDTILAVSDSQCSALFIPQSRAAKMKMTQRNPEVNIIVDWSKDGSVDDRTVLDAINHIAQNFPEAKRFTLTFANYGILDCAAHLQPSDLAFVCNEQMKSGTFERKGGFLGDRAVRHAIMKSPSNDTYPLVVVITKSEKSFSKNSGSYFSRKIPDIDGFYYTSDGKILSALSFNGVPLSTLTHYPVRMIEVDSENVFIKADGRDHLMALKSTGAKEIAKYNVTAYSAAGSYHPEIIQCADGSKGYSALQSFSFFYLKEVNPSRTDISKSLIAQSRKSGVLNGASSYIVVEDPSQWRILEEKEKQKLDNNEELEVMNSPEPPLWLMILCVAGFIAVKRLKDNIRGRRRPSTSEQFMIE